MATHWTSLFSEDNCSFPYFVITGMTTDNIISDELAISDVKMALFRHLTEQGFDAVIFYDSVHMIHFYDAKSSFVMRNLFVPTPRQLESALARGNTTEPLAQPTTGFHHLRFGAARNAQENNQNWGDVWEMNMGQVSVERSYSLLSALLRRTNLRCAVVFTDCMAMQLENGADAVRLRHAMLTAPLSNRAANKNIIIFMMESDSHTSIRDSLLPSSMTGDLVSFFDSYLLPKLSNDATMNHLCIQPPHAAEVRNMFNMMRVSNGLKVDMRNFRLFSSHLATYCSKNWVSLSTLYNLVNIWHIGHPGETFGMAEASQLSGAKEYKSPWQQLEDLVGLDEVKQYFHRLRQMSFFQNYDESDSPGRLWVNRFSSSIRGHGLNLVLLGNPGTGKSTIAAIVGDLYRSFGLLPAGHVVNVSATEIINADVLHSQVRAAMGGVLLIEEAYALMNRFDGQNIVDALVADMGTFAGQFAVVLCGYEEPTLNLLETNDGLRRRFPLLNTLHLPDYSWEELKQIFFSMARQDDTVDVSSLLLPENEAVLNNIFKGWTGEAGPRWGNAGEAENLLNAMKSHCADRMSKEIREEEDQTGRKLMLTLQDIPEFMHTWSSSSEQDLAFAIQELENLTGLGNVKRVIFQIARTIQLSNGAVREPGFYVFQGPPGTGKSMMAEKMGMLLQKLHLIKRRTPYVITAKKLLEPPAAKRPGETVDPRKNSLEDALSMAENGILFIDEAHQLADCDEGKALLQELVSMMDTAEFRRKHCIILAGYIAQMEKLFATCDSGLQSRFPQKNRIKFKNYSASELTSILEKMAIKDGEIPDADFLKRTETALLQYLSTPRPSFGNARFMRNEYLEAAKEKRNNRILREKLGIVSNQVLPTKEQLQQLTPQDLHTLTADDLPDKPIPFAAFAGPKDAIPEEPLTSQRMTDLLFDKEEVKAYIRQITDAFESGSSYSGGMNYTVSGPLGSGKSTVVHTIANVLADLDLIDSKEVFFLSKGDLEAGFVGQTSGETHRRIAEAQGGTVAILYPSAMLPHSSSDNSFGPEALATVFNCIGQYSSNTSFVFIDTEAGMETFMKAYPACRSDFARHFLLDDLSIEGMQQVFHQKSKDFLFADDIAPLMDDFVANWTADRGGLGTNFLSWANGDEIDKLLHTLEDNWKIENGQTGVNKKKRSCPIITKAMFPFRLHKYLKATRDQKEQVLQQKDNEVGLERVRKAIHAIEVRMRRSSPERVMPGHYCFKGNPGVGKTRMAQKLGNVLQATNVLKQGLVITRTAHEMMQQLDDFDKLIRMARENVLFIDEAHQLATSPAGVAVIKRLLTVLEDAEVMKNTCIVLAGYPQEMDHLFTVDAGLQSRFDTEDSIIYFDDYTVDELMQLLTLFGKNASTEAYIGSDRNYDLTSPDNAPFMAEARKGLEYVVSLQNPNYGNARYVRNLLHDTLVHQMLRLDELHPNNELISEDEWAILLPEDLPEKYRSNPEKTISPFT